ncbi:PF20097 family protein [Intestinibacillus massiliensis]|uniref:PF20097 family protein n=1 Tax=Intestinibacillus massiliensis TaxID=1871029 RepID=UPI000B34BB54|nr:PF20097 family protein [Intestinibacillus massiliensis]MCB6365067.1 PF20097 family protein [Intestinibacillus massiliensis]
MNCPYCGKDLLEGKLIGDHHQLRWLPKDKKLLFGLWAAGGLRIGTRMPSQKAEAATYYCSYCKKMIIDVDNC